MLLAIMLAAIAIFVGLRVTFDSIEERFVNQLIEAGKLSSEWTVREENRMLETLRYVMYTDGFIVLKGSMGTLAELALVWNLAKIDAKHRKPIVLLGEHWVQVLRARREHGGNG